MSKFNISFVPSIPILAPSSLSSPFLNRNLRSKPNFQQNIAFRTCSSTNICAVLEHSENFELDGKSPGSKKSSRPQLSTEELLSAFEARIDLLEKDLEESVSASSSVSAQNRKALRRQKHEDEKREKREKYLRRLNELSSLPAELVVETSTRKCSGCGITLQSDSSARPGFLPLHILEEIAQHQLDKTQGDGGVESSKQKPGISPICQRCYRLTHYGALDPRLRVLTKNAAAVATRVTKASTKSEKSLKRPKSKLSPTAHKEPVTPSPELTPSKFRRCLQQLQTLNAVVIYLVDIFDFHGSFIPALRDIIGSKNPIILALNKVDLLPADYKKSRVGLWIQRECRALHMDNIDGVHFISSVQGTGVAELLADALRLARKKRADIYVVGAANVGKSSFINQLIRRQRKAGSKGKLQTAQLSVNPDHISAVDDDDDDDTVNEDSPSVYGGKDSSIENEDISKLLDTDSSVSENATPKEMKKPKPKDALTTSVIPGTTLDVVKIPLGHDTNLYDTPGLMVSHQLTNLLNEDDLRLVVPSRSVENVSFRVSESKAIFIGGLARVELAEGRPFFFTCFFSRDVKIHLGRADDADSFTRKHVGKMLSPPSSLEGFERLGEWTSKSFVVEGDGWKRSCIDVVLSGLGWISITGAGQARVRIWVPKNVGVFTRDPLMPFEIREGVSSYTGGRAINKKLLRKRKKKVEDCENDDFDLDWL